MRISRLSCNFIGAYFVIHFLFTPADQHQVKNKCQTMSIWIWNHPTWHHHNTFKLHGAASNSTRPSADYHISLARLGLTCACYDLTG